MGYVYKITNTVNNKAYIGISIHEPKKRRIKEHLSGRGNRAIANAVKKYGKDAFTYEILEENVFDEFLPDLEVEYIANHNTIAPNGYNLNSGGVHAIPSEETRRKTSEAKKGTNTGENHHYFGKKLSIEHRRNLSEAHKGQIPHNKGKPHSPETRRKMSEAHKGRTAPNKGKTMSAESRRKMSEARKGKKRKPHSPETRRKISESNKGKTHTAETRRKMSEARKGKKRKPHTAETRRKMSEAHKGRTAPNLGKPMSKEQRLKISESNRHPEYGSAHKFFLSLPSDMPLRGKRELLYTKFQNVHRETIRRWVRKWTS